MCRLMQPVSRDSGELPRPKWGLLWRRRGVISRVEVSEPGQNVLATLGLEPGQKAANSSTRHRGGSDEPWRKLLSRLGASISGDRSPFAPTQSEPAMLTHSFVQAIDLGYQYVDPQSQMGVQEEAVPLPQFGELGTNHAFLNKGDGDGQSTKDMALFQQLAVKQVLSLPLTRAHEHTPSCFLSLTRTQQQTACCQTGPLSPLNTRTRTHSLLFSLP